MDGYKVQEFLQCCGNCKHLAWVDNHDGTGTTACNINKNEPKYKKDSNFYNKHETWVGNNEVSLNGICNNYKRRGDNER